MCSVVIKYIRIDSNIEMDLDYINKHLACQKIAFAGKALKT